MSLSINIWGVCVISGGIRAFLGDIAVITVQIPGLGDVWGGLRIGAFLGEFCHYQSISGGFMSFLGG